MSESCLGYAGSWVLLGGCTFMRQSTVQDCPGKARSNYAEWRSVRPLLLLQKLPRVHALEEPGTLLLRVLVGQCFTSGCCVDPRSMERVCTVHASVGTGVFLASDARIFGPLCQAQGVGCGGVAGSWTPR